MKINQKDIHIDVITQNKEMENYISIPRENFADMAKELKGLRELRELNKKLVEVLLKRDFVTVEEYLHQIHEKIKDG